MMQHPERGHGADTDSDDEDRERDGSAEQNALETVQAQIRSGQKSDQPAEFNVAEADREGSE